MSSAESSGPPAYTAVSTGDPLVSFLEALFDSAVPSAEPAHYQAEAS